MKIIVVADNLAKNPKFLSEHGLSFYIQKGRSHIFFDTGQGKAVLQNMDLLKINSKQIGSLILSHGHYDHTGSLSKIFSGNSKLKIYAHPGILAKRYACSAGKTSRFIGVRPEDVRWITSRKPSIKWILKPTKISGDIYATGEIPRVNDFEDVGGNFFLNKRGTIPDRMVDDQALFAKTKKGLVIFLGCAHSGVVNTMHYVAGLAGFSKIYAIFGGAHLLNASSERIKQTLEAFLKYKVQLIVLGHCTGEKAKRAIKKNFSKEFLELKTGMKFFIE